MISIEQVVFSSSQALLLPFKGFYPPSPSTVFISSDCLSFNQTRSVYDMKCELDKFTSASGMGLCSLSEQTLHVCAAWAASFDLTLHSGSWRCQAHLETLRPWSQQRVSAWIGNVFLIFIKQYWMAFFAFDISLLLVLHCIKHYLLNLSVSI